MVLTKADVDDIVKLLLINNQKPQQGYVIATLYFKISEYHRALKYVSKYLQIKPKSFVAHKLQGECYEKLNRVDEALKSYGTAPELGDKKSKNIHPPTPMREKNTTDDTTEITFEFRVMHVTSLDGVVCSKTFLFRNILWSVVVVPTRDLGACRTFSFYLLCMGERDSSSHWSCNVDAEFRLLSIRPDRCPYVQKTRHLFSTKDGIWGFPTFMSWYDAVRPDGYYMRDDCITVQAMPDWPYGRSGDSRMAF